MDAKKRRECAVVPLARSRQEFRFSAALSIVHQWVVGMRTSNSNADCRRTAESPRARWAETEGTALHRCLTSMADDAHPLNGAQDRDRDVIARLIDEAQPRAAIAPPSPDEVEAALQGVLARRDQHDTFDAGIVPSERDRSRGSRVLLAAAALLVIVSAGLLLKTATRSTGDPVQAVTTQHEFVTPEGKVASFNLPDSTRVVLGPRSVLTIGPGYGATDRVVRLRGDAYFDVVHHATRVFVVHTPYAELVDIGTAFSVRDAGSLGVQVSVASGRVAARAGRGGRDRATLGASDRALVQQDGHIRVEPGAATADDHAWTQGRLVFRDAPIEYVAAELRRWYGIDLRIGDPFFRSRRLTATFDRATASDVGPVIAAALGGVARRAGDTLYVAPVSLPGGPRRR